MGSEHDRSDMRASHANHARRLVSVSLGRVRRECWPVPLQVNRELDGVLKQPIDLRDADELAAGATPGADRSDRLPVAFGVDHGIKPRGALVWGQRQHERLRPHVEHARTLHQIGHVSPAQVELVRGQVTRVTVPDVLRVLDVCEQCPELGDHRRLGLVDRTVVAS